MLADSLSGLLEKMTRIHLRFEQNSNNNNKQHQNNNNNNSNNKNNIKTNITRVILCLIGCWGKNPDIDEKHQKWAWGERHKRCFFQHVLQLDQGGLTLTSREQYLNKVFLSNICIWYTQALFFVVENFHIFLIFCLVTKYPKTPDNDTVLAALLEVMVETSMLLFRCLQLPLKHRSTKCLKSFETQCESA